MSFIIVYFKNVIGLKQYLKYLKMSLKNNQSINENLGDDIQNLPVDKTPPNNEEMHIVNTLFKKNRSVLDIIFNDSKDVLIIVILITALVHPQISEIITKIIPITNKSEYLLYFVKGIIGGILYWLIKYFYLSRS
jgi:hypothetical protein